MLRIKDIAKIAGVSPTTVSNVIHAKKQRVSEETAARVEKILEECGYRPSVSARMMSGTSSGIICIVTGRMSKNVEKQTEIHLLIRGIELELYQNDYYMALHFSDALEEHLEFIELWKAEGVITIGFDAGQNQKIQMKSRGPVVSIDGEYAEMRGTMLPNVGTDDCGGGYLMGTHLLQYGHRKIQYLTDQEQGSSKMCWMGLKRAWMEAGIYLEESSYSLIPADKKQRREFYKQHLAAMAFAKDVLFFSTDYFAAEAEGYLRDMEIQIPEEISIAGFGDSEWSVCVRPGITTVHRDIPGKAVIAVKKLFDLLENDHRAIENTNLPVHLVVRESVRSLPFSL